MEMFLTVLLTFVVVTATYVFLLWRAVRRVAEHIRGDGEATGAVTEHVLIPLLGRKPKEE